MQNLKKAVLYFINNIERSLSIVIIAVMLTIMFQQVVMRFCFNSPSRWSEEVTRYLHIYMIFICCSYAMKENAHIKVDLINLFPRTARLFLAACGQVVMAAFCVVIIVVSFRLTKDVRAVGQVSTALRIPLWLVFSAIPIGYTLTFIRLVQNQYNAIRDFFRQKNKPQTVIEGDKP